MLSKRVILAVGVGVLVSLAGCAAGSPDADGTTASTVTETEQRTDEDCHRDPPGHPDEVTANSAVEFAQRFESVAVYNDICSRAEFGLTATTATERATVEFVESGVFYVFVRQPYYYTSDGTEADGASSGVYAVGDDGFVRVDHGGGDRSVVEPFESGATRSVRTTVRLYNFNSSGREVTVRLHQDNSSGSRSWRKNVSVSGESGRVTVLQLPPGSYSLTASVGDTRRRVQLTVERPVDGDVAVYLGPDGRLYVRNVSTT